MPSTYFPIFTTTLGATSASITFSSIPASFTDLRLVCVSRTNNTATPREDLFLTFNSDTTSNYSNTILGGQETTSLGFRQANATRINLYVAIPGTATHFSLNTVDIFSYANNTFKTCLVSVNNNQNTVGGQSSVEVGMYRSTSAITSITLTPETNLFGTGSTATLYGIKNA